MANTSYLTRIVEPFVREWVSSKLSVTLAPRRIIVGMNGAGVDVSFAFDGLSPDGTTGLLVSTTHTIKSGGTRKLFMDAAILNRAPFKRRIMVFIRDEVMENFLNCCDGLLDLSQIEMLVCDSCPAEMLAEIAKIQNAAKAEVGDKGKTWKVCGQRK